jgi:hypothetical protein
MYIIRNEGQKEVSMATVKISSGNSKMGSVPSVSLPSIKTCRQCACQSRCYAQKLERLRPAVRNAYQHNLEVLINEPETYWREVEASVMMSRFFRFHVSGDIPTAEYLANMVAVAGRNSHCEILCFTKRYEMVNEFIEQNGELPSNLHMMFSGWIGLDMVNPFSLPEAHVRYRDGSTTACDNAVECGGNCTECAMTDGGCWNLQKGQQVVFNEH